MTEVPTDPQKATSPDTFRVHVRVHEDPFWVQRPKGLVFPDVSNEETVSEFRLRLSRQPGKPMPDSIKLFVSGKPIGLARGAERLKDVLAELDKVRSAHPFPGVPRAVAHSERSMPSLHPEIFSAWLLSGLSHRLSQKHPWRRSQAARPSRVLLQLRANLL